MKRILLLSILLVLLYPLVPSAAKKDSMKAAFLRGGDLWTFIDGKEKRVTNSGKVLAKPQWSADGKLLVYQIEAPSEVEEGKTQSEVWTYNIVTDEKKKIFNNGISPEWAPHKNVIAYNDNGILDVSDLNGFYNIATGVSSFTWLPDGSGFLLSSSGTLRPDGWSSASLFTKIVGEYYEDVQLFGGVQPFFTLPKELGTNNLNQLIAVNVERLNYSPSGKWISFVVSPTASWSMDSNMVCIIDEEGKNFEVLDEVILQVGEPKWAPTTDTIAYIAGGGRIVFGFKNKDLKVREMPVAGTLTPENYADLDFDWITDASMVASRVEERDWNNDFSKHPLPVLYSINLEDEKQTKITNPPKGYGDYAPQYIPSMNKIGWLRGASITDRNRNLWISNTDGTEAAEILHDIEEIVFYQ